MAPFIIVSFFVLQSVLNVDIKGIIYLAGLLMVCTIVTFMNGLVNSFADNQTDVDNPLPNPKCSIITLGEAGGYLSKIPLSLTVYSFTFFYLLIFVMNTASSNPKGVLDTKSMTSNSISSVLQQNLFLFIIFPALILMESLWLLMHNCVQNILIRGGIAILMGAIGGILWALIITSVGNPSLQYMSKSGVDVCNRPSKSLYKCKVNTKIGTI
jgi:hypothetical protein